MKQKTISRFTLLLLLTIAFGNVKAQTWDASAIHTWTGSNVGIGTTPSAVNTNLTINHSLEGVGPGGGLYGINPAVVIQDNFTYDPSLTFYPTWTPHNLVEIWSALYSGMSNIGANNPIFFVTAGHYGGQGQVFISKAMSPASTATLDVGGDISADGNISTVNNGNFGAGNITNNLSVGGNSSVTGNGTIGGNFTVTGALSAGSWSITNLTVTNNASVGNILTVTSDANIGGNVSATGNGGFANVTGNNGTFGNNITVGHVGPSYTSFESVNNGLFDQNLTVSGNLSVTGNTTIGGNISITGAASCTAMAWTSDAAFKKNITTLTNARDQLFQVNPYKYQFKKESSTYFKFDDKDHFGFIAEEVQKIYPNLTSIVDKEGHLGINYVEFIPLLLQTLKEEDAIVKQQADEIADLKNNTIAQQNEKINQLQNQLVTLQNSVNTLSKNSSSTDNPNNSNSGSTLDQNTPNPFGNETKIGFHILGSFSQAFIGIYDLNGQQVQKLAIQPGATQVTFASGQLKDGMYVYSLIVDNSIIDSKRMVISR